MKVVWLGGDTDGVTHLDQDAPTPAQPVRPPKWAAALLSVACTAVAGVLFLPLSTAVAFAAGASLFGQPESEPDEWWFPYAMFNVRHRRSRLGRRRVCAVTPPPQICRTSLARTAGTDRHGAGPRLAAHLTAPETPLGGVAQHLADQPLGAPTGRGFGAVTVGSNGFQNIGVFDVNSGAVIGSFESSTTRWQGRCRIRQGGGLPSDDLDQLADQNRGIEGTRKRCRVITWCSPADPLGFNPSRAPNNPVFNPADEAPSAMRRGLEKDAATRRERTSRRGGLLDRP